MGGKLGIEQLPIDRKLKTPAIGGYQGERFYIRLKFLEQFGCQTGSTIGVVSDCAVDQIEFQ
jgi:hypothetical protein